MKKNKKFLWIVLLILFIIAIIIGLTMIKPKNAETNNMLNKTALGREENAETNSIEDDKKEDVEYKKIELDDGILYSKNGEQIKPDLVIKEKYYDTTINDMYVNPEDYMGQYIEIEGMYLLSSPSSPFTFVGRYSLSNLCPSCPTGYSVLEYQIDGKIDAEFRNEETWIKVIGKLERDIDDETDEEYYYIKAENLEIMNEKGNDTVSN